MLAKHLSFTVTRWSVFQCVGHVHGDGDDVMSSFVDWTLMMERLSQRFQSSPQVTVRLCSHQPGWLVLPWNWDQLRSCSHQTFKLEAEVCCRNNMNHASMAFSSFSLLYW